MDHHAKYAPFGICRFQSGFLLTGCLAAVLMVCPTTVAQTPAENPPVAPQNPQQPPIGEPIRPRVPKGPNRNNPTQNPANPANPSNPDPNNAGAAQPVGNQPTP